MPIEQVAGTEGVSCAVLAHRIGRQNELHKKNRENVSIRECAFLEHQNPEMTHSHGCLASAIGGIEEGRYLLSREQYRNEKGRPDL